MQDTTEITTGTNSVITADELRVALYEQARARHVYLQSKAAAYLDALNDPAVGGRVTTAQQIAICNTAAEAEESWRADVNAKVALYRAGLGIDDRPDE